MVSDPWHKICFNAFSGVGTIYLGGSIGIDGRIYMLVVMATGSLITNQHFNSHHVAVF